MKDPKIGISISLPLNTIRQIDKARKDKSRSEFLFDLIKEKFNLQTV